MAECLLKKWLQVAEPSKHEIKRLQVGPAHQLGEDHGTAGDVAEQEEEENHDGSNHVGFVWRL